MYSKFTELNIQLKDKSFKPYLSTGEIADAVSLVSDGINKNYGGKNPIVLGVLNGAFMFCADLAKKLTCNPEIHFVKMASYDGVESTGQVTQLIGLNVDLTNRYVIIVEDIVDTGLTIERLRDDLKDLGAASIKVATFLFKPDAFKGKHHPDFIGKEIPNDFVVGYGLDYDGLGRELSELYVLNN